LINDAAGNKSSCDAQIDPIEAWLILLDLPGLTWKQNGRGSHPYARISPLEPSFADYKFLL
jgi:hypothetical protein